jgi:putative ubiquitin-RnfH superfamily antitoxin RatB of RatAB toxin-antitoxin module
MLSNLAPAIIGLAASAMGLIYARHLRLKAEAARQDRVEAARPAE